MKRKIIVLIILALYCNAGFSQGDNTEPLYKRMMSDTSVTNFYDIQHEFNQYFESRDKGRGSGWVQFKRWETMMEPAVFPDGKMFNISARTFEEYNQYVENFNYDGLPSNYDPGYWISMGPSTYKMGEGWNAGNGRVNCIAFHPTDAGIIYAGTPAGGLWRTTDYIWAPLTDGFPSIGVSGIAIEPDDPNHIYILTGDGDGGQTGSIGVLETWDAGLTWNATGLTWGVTDNVRGYKLNIHPTNHDILLAATSVGIFRTTDGGTTWQNEQSGWFMDIEFKPGTPSTLYATDKEDFYKSTNTGDTWAITGTGLPGSGSVRIGIGVTPDNSNYVYLMYGRSSNNNTVSGFMGCYLSTNSGSSFTLKSDSPNIFGYKIDGNDFKEQAAYDLAFAVDPDNAAILQFGGINCWKSIDNGVNWTHTSFWKSDTIGEEYTHADIHWLEYNPLNHYLYAGSDGGFFRSLNNANTWTNYSDGLVILQSYRMGGFQGDENLFVTGTQDNGGNTLEVETEEFTHDIGADGFESMIDVYNSELRYESTYADLFRTEDGGFTWEVITPNYADSNFWNVAWVMNPVSSYILYVGQEDIWRSLNYGDTWYAMNTGNSGEFFNNIAHGVNDLEYIYGQTVQRIYRSWSSGSAWIDKTENLPVAYCWLSNITVDADDATHIFVSCYGFAAGIKVYESFNSGDYWTNISGSLPNVQMRCLVYDHNSEGLYVGTDVGVFYRDASTGNWVPFFNMLPSTIVMEMEINYNSGYITAVTFGRGFWKSKLYGSCAASYILTPGNDPGTGHRQYYAAQNNITSTRTVVASFSDSVDYQAGNYVTLLPGFEAQSGSNFGAKAADCNDGKQNLHEFRLEDRVPGRLVRKPVR